MNNRKLIIFSSLGLPFLAALVALWWFLGDDAWLKGKIERAVSETTGRSFSIDGAFALDWSMNPVLTAGGVRLSAPSWAVHPESLWLEDLEVSIDLSSVFKDQVRVNYLEAGNLRITLEENESEGHSWAFKSDDAESSSSSKAPADKLPVRFDRIQITGLTVLDEAPERVVPLDFHLDQLELIQETGGDIRLDAGGRFGGERLEFSGKAGPLDGILSGGKVSHDLRLSLGEITLHSRGVVEQLSKISGANIKLEFSGPEIEWLLTQLALPSFSHGDFDFKLDVQTEAEQTHLDLEGDLGSLQARAKGNLDERTNSADLKADVSGEDLGGLLEVAGLPGLPREPFDLVVDVDHAAGMYRIRTMKLESSGASVSVEGQLGDWPQLVDSELEFLVSGTDLQTWGKSLPPEFLHGTELPATDFELGGQITRTGTQPASTDTQLRLGKNRLWLSGSLGRLPSMEGAALAISADGPVNGALVQMSGIRGIPGEDFSLKAKLERDADYFYLRDASIDLGGNHLELSGKSGPWPEHKNARLVFSLLVPEPGDWSDALEIGRLPASPLEANGEIGFAGIGLVIDRLDLKLGDNTLKANGQINLNDDLQGSRLQARLDLPNLAGAAMLIGRDDLPEGRLGFNGDFGRIPGGWSFRLSNGSFEGASFNSKGKYTVIDGQAQIEATSRISAPSLATIGRIAGIENLPEQALQIEGYASYQAGKVELRALEGNVGDSQFSVSATLMNPPNWSGSTIRLSASGPDIGQLLADLDTGMDRQGALPFSVNGEMTRTEKAIQVNRVKARLGKMEAMVDGNLDDTSASNLEFTITAPSLKPVGTFFDFKLPDEPLHLNAVLRGSPTVFRAEQLKFELGASNLAGEIGVDLTGKPKIDSVLDSSYLDLRWLFDEDGGPSPGAEPGETGARDYLIPDVPIALPRLDFADSDITIRVAESKLPNLTVHDVYLRTMLTDGKLVVKPFQAGGEQGGSLTGSLVIDQHRESGLTDVALSLEGSGVRLGLATAEGQDPETIQQTDISVNLSGSGSTYHELASSLNGRAELVWGPGLTVNGGWGLIFGNFITEIIDLLNPFAKTEKYTVNECAVAVVNIKSGLLVANPVVSHTDKMTIVAEGEVDLHTENLLFTFNTKLRKGTGISASMVVNPFLSVTGTLLQPVIGLDPAAVAVKGSVAVATMGLSLLVHSLADRYLSSKDPCGDALKQAREKQKSLGK